MASQAELRQYLTERGLQPTAQNVNRAAALFAADQVASSGANDTQTRLRATQSVDDALGDFAARTGTGVRGGSAAASSAPSGGNPSRASASPTVGGGAAPLTDTRPASADATRRAFAPSSQASTTPATATPSSRPANQDTARSENQPSRAAAPATADAPQPRAAPVGNPDDIAASEERAANLHDRGIIGTIIDAIDGIRPRQPLNSYGIGSGRYGTPEDDAVRNEAEMIAQTREAARTAPVIDQSRRGAAAGATGGQLDSAIDRTMATQPVAITTVPLTASSSVDPGVGAGGIGGAPGANPNVADAGGYPIAEDPTLAAILFGAVPPAAAAVAGARPSAPLNFRGRTIEQVGAPSRPSPVVTLPRMGSAPASGAGPIPMFAPAADYAGPPMPGGGFVPPQGSVVRAAPGVTAPGILPTNGMSPLTRPTAPAATMRAPVGGPGVQSVDPIQAELQRRAVPSPATSRLQNRVMIPMSEVDRFDPMSARGSGIVRSLPIGPGGRLIDRDLRRGPQR